MKLIHNRRLTYEGTLVSGAGFFLLFGACMFVNTAHFLRTSEKTAAVVTKLVEVSRTGDAPNSYAPVFKFSDKGGKSYEVQSRGSSRPSAFSTGEQTKVYFDPKNPRDFLSDDFFTLWGWATIVCGIGVGFIVALARELRVCRGTS
jgi:Protein of unknown function (DUF3592)